MIIIIRLRYIDQRCFNLHLHVIKTFNQLLCLKRSHRLTKLLWHCPPVARNKSHSLASTRYRFQNCISGSEKLERRVSRFCFALSSLSFKTSPDVRTRVRIWWTWRIFLKICSLQSSALTVVRLSLKPTCVVCVGWIVIGWHAPLGLLKSKWLKGWEKWVWESKQKRVLLRMKKGKEGMFALFRQCDYSLTHIYYSSVKREGEIMPFTWWEQNHGEVCLFKDRARKAKSEHISKESTFLPVCLCRRKAAWIFDEILLAPKTAVHLGERDSWNGDIEGGVILT